MNASILIIAPIPPEYEAIRKRLKNVTPIDNGQLGVLCEIGKFKGKFGNQQVAILQKGKGGIEIALATERAIQFFSPKIIFLVGTAATLKPVKIPLQSIIIGEKGYYYEGGREMDNSFASFPKISFSSSKLIKLAKVISRDKFWQERQIVKSQSKVFFGPIVSGEKVIETITSRTYQHIRQQYNDAIGLEMEAYAFLETVSHYPNIDKLIIRSVSDQLIDKQTANNRGSKEVASDLAAAFTFELLYHLPLKKHSNSRNILWKLGAVSLMIICLLTYIYKPFSNSSPLEIENIPTKKSLEKHKPPVEKKIMKKIVPSIEHKNSSPPKQKSFSTNITLGKAMITHLTNSLNATYKQNDALLNVEFRHTGTIERNHLHDDLFYYSGGQLQVVVNGILCCCEATTTLQIPASSFPGNSLAVEKAIIEKAKINLLNQQIISITSAIKKCL